MKRVATICFKHTSGVCIRASYRLALPLALFRRYIASNNAGSRANLVVCFNTTIDIAHH